MTNKIVDIKELGARAGKLRAGGKRIVLTNGCFDLLHVGHVRYLEAARGLGDLLVVGVNSDQSVRNLKGAHRPINNERDRAEVIAALSCVDLVAIFHETRAVRLLEEAAPAIYTKGGDYTLDSLDPTERAVLEKLGAEIRILPLESGYSTSALLQKLSERGE